MESDLDYNSVSQMDVCPPDSRLSHDLHSSLYCLSINLSFSTTFTLVCHPSILLLFLPHAPSPLVHTINRSHYLCSAFHPYILSCFSPAVSPDITSNHILNSSPKSSLSTHPSLPVPSSLLSSPLKQILYQAHYLHYTQYTQESIMARTCVRIRLGDTDGETLS